MHWKRLCLPDMYIENVSPRHRTNECLAVNPSVCCQFPQPFTGEPRAASQMENYLWVFPSYQSWRRDENITETRVLPFIQDWSGMEASQHLSYSCSVAIIALKHFFRVWSHVSSSQHRRCLQNRDEKSIMVIEFMTVSYLPTEIFLCSHFLSNFMLDMQRIFFFSGGNVGKLVFLV